MRMSRQNINKGIKSQVAFYAGIAIGTPLSKDTEVYHFHEVDKMKFRGKISRMAYFFVKF